MIGDGEALGFRQLLLEAAHDLAGSPKDERDGVAEDIAACRQH